MQKVDYYKYASNGNNFVLIDEIAGEKIPEASKCIFSKYIEDNVSGIGCDSVIFLQKYDDKTLNEIYGDNIKIDLKDSVRPEYIFRVYEKGLESNMCGNGLMCAGFHLAHLYAVTSANIATECPTRSPVIRQFSYKGEGVTTAMLGRATLPLVEFVNYSAIALEKNQRYLQLRNFPLRINLKGEIHHINTSDAYIAFTGEPHIVFFKQKNNHEIFNIIFNVPETEEQSSMINNLIDQIGWQLSTCLNYFPKGINVNFSDVISKNEIVNRCFERGINAETYACGTGAVAVAHMASELGLISGDEISILPFKARQHDLYKNAKMQISIADNQYSITASSFLLSKGEYYFSLSINQNEIVFNFAA